MLAGEYWNIRPDLMTMAKGLGGGLPIGAFVAKEEIAAAFDPGDHFSTFGGNPVCCAAALANVEAIMEEKISENVAKLGKHATVRLNDLMNRYPIIGDVRGKG